MIGGHSSSLTNYIEPIDSDQKLHLQVEVESRSTAEKIINVNTINHQSEKNLDNKQILQNSLIQQKRPSPRGTGQTSSSTNIAATISLLSNIPGINIINSSSSSSSSSYSSFD